jgi:hypothetical protein
LLLEDIGLLNSCYLRVAVVLDAVWVVGAYMLILVIPFSAGGKWVVVLVAELVLAFAILQWLGIRRVRRSEPYA